MTHALMHATCISPTDQHALHPQLNDQYESHMLVIVKINACIDMSRRRTELGEVDFISL